MASDGQKDTLKADVHKWITQHRGQLALYMEYPTRISVRIYEAEANDEGVILKLINIPHTGIPAISKASFEISASWDILSCSDQTLSASYIPWRLHVDLDLVIQVIALARRRAEQGKELDYTEMSYPSSACR